ncbi:signal peptidase II [Propionicicella superfundia]|uniref:signal peptidase II n=1 Tax=Propionicicella superfundia TaxID=348582 RepID=UPI0003FDFD0C|nr:signal peptidase II [Propionicicella superfundia]
MQAAGGTAIDASTKDLRRVRLTLLAVALTAYVLDQVTKQLAVTFLDPDRPVRLIGDLLVLRLVFNPGAAFSLGEDFTVVISVFALAALVFVLFWVVPRVGDLRWATAIGLMLCGIAGNLTDRLLRPPGPFRGHVVDFLQLPYWAIFNVADMCLVFGAALLAWFTIVRPVPLGGRLAVADEPASAQDDA